MTSPPSRFSNIACWTTSALDPQLVEDVDTAYVVNQLFEGLYNSGRADEPGGRRLQRDFQRLVVDRLDTEIGQRLGARDDLVGVHDVHQAHEIGIGRSEWPDRPRAARRTRSHPAVTGSPFDHFASRSLNV